MKNIVNYCVMLLGAGRKGTEASIAIKHVYVAVILLLALPRKGNTQPDCDASERTVLKCNFSRNMNSTETDFSVYFKFDDGHEELLVKCVWPNHRFQCLKQEGFNITQQVSETAEISLPTRFESANGTYRCNIEGLKKQEGKPCRSDEEQEEIQSSQLGGSIYENRPSDKVESHILRIAGGVSGAAVAICVLGLIIMATYRYVKKRPWKFQLTVNNDITYSFEKLKEQHP